MRGGKGILAHFLLVLGEDVELATAEAAQQLCRSFSDVVESRSSHNSGMTLVRPDGYIAYAAHSRNGLRALAAMRAVLERQTAHDDALAPQEVGGSAGG